MGTLQKGHFEPAETRSGRPHEKDLKTLEIEIGEARRRDHANQHNRTQKALRSSALYSSRIIKAGALIGDTKTLLSHWDVDASVDENIHRMQRNNVFGKASRSHVEDILAIFRQRYLTEESVTKALVTLVRGKGCASKKDRP